MAIDPKLPPWLLAQEDDAMARNVAALSPGLWLDFYGEQLRQQATDGIMHPGRLDRYVLQVIFSVYTWQQMHLPEQSFFEFLERGTQVPLVSEKRMTPIYLRRLDTGRKLTMLHPGVYERDTMAWSVFDHLIQSYVDEVVNNYTMRAFMGATRRIDMRDLEQGQALWLFICQQADPARVQSTPVPRLSLPNWL